MHCRIHTYGNPVPAVRLGGLTSLANIRTMYNVTVCTVPVQIGRSHIDNQPLTQLGGHTALIIRPLNNGVLYSGSTEIMFLSLPPASIPPPLSFPPSTPLLFPSLPQFSLPLSFHQPTHLLHTSLTETQWTLSGWIVSYECLYCYLSILYS